jgi:hypothetical protein
MTLLRGGFIGFIMIRAAQERLSLCVVSESRTEGGRRQGSEGDYETLADDSVWSRVLAVSPVFMATPRTVKSFT